MGTLFFQTRTPKFFSSYFIMISILCFKFRGIPPNKCQSSRLSKIMKINKVVSFSWSKQTQCFYIRSILKANFRVIQRVEVKLSQ